jgi:hypothetical protein
MPTPALQRKNRPDRGARCRGTSGCSPSRSRCTSASARGRASSGSSSSSDFCPGVDSPAYGLWRSLVSASVWGTEGRGFKSRQPDTETAGQDTVTAGVGAVTVACGAEMVPKTRATGGRARRAAGRRPTRAVARRSAAGRSYHPRYRTPQNRERTLLASTRRGPCSGCSTPSARRAAGRARAKTARGQHRHTQPQHANADGSRGSRPQARARPTSWWGVPTAWRPRPSARRYDERTTPALMVISRAALPTGGPAPVRLGVQTGPRRSVPNRRGTSRRRGRR